MKCHTVFFITSSRLLLVFPLAFIKMSGQENCCFSNLIALSYLTVPTQLIDFIESFTFHDFRHGRVSFCCYYYHLLIYDDGDYRQRNKTADRIFWVFFFVEHLY